MARSRRKPIRPEPARRPDARSAAPRPAPDWLVFGLALAGVLLSAYLSWVAFGRAAPAFCAEGGGCDLVQRSQWSMVFGIPVALFGLATYALLALFAVAPQTRLKRWQRSFAVAFVALAVSAFMNLAAGWSLEAACGWCLVSLALVAAIFAAVALRRPPSAPGTAWRDWWLGNGLFVAVLLVALHLYWSGLFTPRPEPRLEALAKHLSTSGAKFYGTFWCPNCREQKAMFGGAADQLPYVECTPDGRRGRVAFECVDAEVRAYPTWVIRGRRYEEVLDTEELARRSGFRWQNPSDG